MSFTRSAGYTTPGRLTTTGASTSSFFNRLPILLLDPNNSASYPGTGTTYTDVSGYGHHFTKSSGTFISTPIKCFQAGIFSTNTGNFIGGDVTIQAWINTTGVGTQVSLHYRLMQIMSAEIPGNPGNPTDFGFGIGSTGKLVFGNGPSDTSVTSTTAVNTGVWLNVAVTRNNSTGAVRLYINGVLDKSGSTEYNRLLNVQPNLLIGAGTDGGTNWSGYMGSIIVYDKVLSNDAILSNFTTSRATYGV
jgi:hypothetical protein